MYICNFLTLIYTTMAIVKNFWLKGSKKRLGGAVLYQAMGQTRARELASEVSNPRTEAQMSQRIKWSNLVNFYRANASWMKYAFESKKANQSEYNKFMSLNVSNSRIALTKQAAAAGAAVADAYILTQGSLPSIEWSRSANVYVSNIYTDGLSEITKETRVSEIAAALINNNPAIQQGDQLSFIRVSQMVNGSTGYPYIIVRKYEVILDPTNSALLNDYIPTEFLSSENIGDEYTLNVLAEGRKGGFCMILSRTLGGRTYVSSQSLVVVNNADIISAWSGQTAIDAAIASYGESADAFLSTRTANTANRSPVGNSILLMAADGTNYAPNAKLPEYDNWYGVDANLVFSSELTAEDTLGAIEMLMLDGKRYNINTGTIQQGVVRFSFPESEVEPTARVLLINATVSDTTYTIKFASVDQYSDGGLE